MEGIRKLIKEKIPHSIMMRIVQSSLSLPPTISRFLIADFTAPTRSQRQWIKMIQQPHWKGAWIGPALSLCENDNQLSKRIHDADLIIFNVHGGAFRIGHCTMYMDVFTNWIHLLKEIHDIDALILSIEYSLAPEHMYPTPVLECVAAYEYLTYTLKVPGSKIILSGDSAGGALCLETLIRVYAPEILRDLSSPRTNHAIQLPAGLFLVSPLVSANISTWLWQYKEDLVTPLLATRVLKEYLNLPDAQDKEDELHLLKLSQIDSDFHRFLPSHVLVYVGQREVMRDDILKMVNAIQQDHGHPGDRIKVQVRQENYEHDWYFIREVVRPEHKSILVHSDLQFVAYAAAATVAARYHQGKADRDKSSVMVSHSSSSSSSEKETLHAVIKSKEEDEKIKDINHHINSTTDIIDNETLIAPAVIA